MQGHTKRWLCTFLFLEGIILAFAFQGIKKIKIPVKPEELRTQEGAISVFAKYLNDCISTHLKNVEKINKYAEVYEGKQDILSKIRHDMPEDDSRVPNVIADFIGDNVNDIAGNCSDLLESFVATISASIMIAISIFKNSSGISVETFNATTLFPVILAGAGLLGCLVGLFFISQKKMSANPSHELNLATWLSAGITLVLSLIASSPE